MNKFFKGSFKKSFDSVNPLFFELIIATAITVYSKITGESKIV